VGDVAVSLDMMPALVRFPHGGTIDPARIFVSNRGVLVVVASGSGVSAIFERPSFLSLSGSRLAGYDIQVDDGIVTAWQGKGCNCGNVLSGYDPWPGERRIAVG
jgi:hypothetical protein